jgi:hypothetical protein
MSRLHSTWSRPLHTARVRYMSRSESRAVEQLVSQARMRTRSMPRMRHALLNLAWLENNNNCNLLRAKTHGERTRRGVANLRRDTVTGCYTGVQKPLASLAAPNGQRRRAGPGIRYWSRPV